MMKKIFYIFLFVPFCINGLAQSMVPKAPKLNLDSYILLEASTNTVIAIAAKAPTLVSFDTFKPFTWRKFR